MLLSNDVWVGTFMSLVLRVGNKPQVPPITAELRCWKLEPVTVEGLERGV